MNRWALRMPRDAAPALGPLRLLPGIEAASVGDEVWLRGDALTEDQQQRLRAVPGADRFFVNQDGELTPAGARLPTGWLPEAGWLPLAELVRPSMSLAALPAAAPARLPLTLVRDNGVRPVSAILTSFDAWSAYAESAPLVRLSRLAFLADHDARVLIVGTPLPPLAGDRYWETDGIYVAAGFHWQPAVDARLVRRSLGLAEGELALWHSDGLWERASRDDLVAARRSAVRATREGLSHGPR